MRICVWMEAGLRVWLGSRKTFLWTQAAMTNSLTMPRRPKHERITKQEVEDVIESYRRMKWWP